MDYERNPHFKELLKGFESSRVFGHVHPYDLFRQWLEAVWAMLEAWRDPEEFKAKTYKLTYEQGAEFGRLFKLYVSSVEDMPFSDILGELFMRLDVNSVRAGQFFTPFPIAEFMSKVTFDKDTFMNKAKEKGCVTVCDPACGSGVMLLAFAKVVHDALGRDGTGKLELYGMDTDIRCVLMCRIQLRLNGLDSFGKMAGRLGLMQGARPGLKVCQNAD
jgi:methylase of polypeptide subunit release factors